MSYVTGEVIKTLREKKGLTQKELANVLCVSDKTVSKWENKKGLPDIGILADLAKSLGVSVAELLTGELKDNQNVSANMKKSLFYVCPICGNIIQAVGQGEFSCCGIALPQLEAEEMDEQHKIIIETVDNEYYVHLEHVMTKEHYISFVAYVTAGHTELRKFYPEQTAETRFRKNGHGIIYAFCNRHGLMKCRV